MRNVLLIAYHFPPCAEGGVMRVRAFAKHLSAVGWRPTVLTVEEKYYASFTQDPQLVQELCGVVQIVRTGSWEPAGGAVKQLQASIYGVQQTGSAFERWVKPTLRQFYRAFVLPDEHILWLPQAVKTGLQIIKQNQVDVLFATTPPHSTGVIGALLSRLSGKPLVLDVRDDWVGNPLFDVGPWTRRLSARLLERLIVRTASRVISVTEESMALFRQKYPSQPATKFHFIPNGFDAEEIDALVAQIEPKSNSKLRLVYIGTLGRTRTPLALLQALKLLAEEERLVERLQFDIYGYSRYDYAVASAEMGLEEIIHFHGFVSREESLRQLLLADVALMIIPAEEGSRTAIPGKLYEYIGAQRFVLALCPLQSAPGRLIKWLNLGLVAPQDDPEQIKQALLRILEQHSQNALQVHFSGGVTAQFGRFNQTQSLADIFAETL